MTRMINVMVMFVVFGFVFFNFFVAANDSKAQIADDFPIIKMDDVRRDFTGKQNWELLDASHLTGDGATIPGHWNAKMQEIMVDSTLPGNRFSCYEIAPLEDQTTHGRNKEQIAVINASGGQRQYRLARAGARANDIINMLHRMGMEANRVRVGRSYANIAYPDGKGNGWDRHPAHRGAIVARIDNCLPKPAINCWDFNGNSSNDPEEDTNKDNIYDTKDCVPEAGKSKVNIDYDLGYQGLYGEEGTLHSVFFRANWPATQNIYISAGVQTGNIDGSASAGAELSAEYRNPWVNPRVVLVGRALELDTRLAFRRAEFGGGIGLERTLIWSWLMGEVRYERKWIGEAPHPHYTGINSLMAFIGLRFGGNNEDMKEEGGDL